MDDLINRKAVIDALTYLHTHDGMELGASVDFAGACEVVCGIPAVDAEPVRRMECDFCGRGKPIKAYTYLPDCGLQYGTSVKAIYCPICGARMDGEEDCNG